MIKKIILKTFFTINLIFFTIFKIQKNYKEMSLEDLRSEF